MNEENSNSLSVWLPIGGLIATLVVPAISAYLSSQFRSPRLREIAHLNNLITHLEHDDESRSTLIEMRKAAVAKLATPTNSGAIWRASIGLFLYVAGLGLLFYHYSAFVTRPSVEYTITGAAAAVSLVASFILLLSTSGPMIRGVAAFIRERTTSRST